MSRVWRSRQARPIDYDRPTTDAAMKHHWVDSRGDYVAKVIGRLTDTPQTSMAIAQQMGESWQKVARALLVAANFGMIRTHYRDHKSALYARRAE